MPKRPLTRPAIWQRRSDRRQNAVIAGEVNPRPVYQRCQTRDEIYRIESHLCRPVSLPETPSNNGFLFFIVVYRVFGRDKFKNYKLAGIICSTFARTLP